MLRQQPVILQIDDHTTPDHRKPDAASERLLRVLCSALRQKQLRLEEL